MKVIINSLLLLLLASGVMAQTESRDQQQRHERKVKYLLKQINKVRTKGCRCGRERMPKVAKLEWSDTLEYSAYLHAKEMSDHNYFAHRSINGEDIGQRLDNLGYKWQYVGENLADGQDSFPEALEDWLASESHCRMIMNPNMKEMGLSRVGRFWVHHFGAQMPPKTRRVSTTYTEG